MVKFYIQNLTTSCVIGIEGDNEIEIERWYYSFFNHKATSSDLNWYFNKKFAYFWSTPEKFRKALFD